VVISLERDADCLHMVQLMPLHSQTPSSFASFKSTLVLPFCYRLTQVVLEKRSLNGCSSLSVVCAAGSMYLSGVHLSVRLSVHPSAARRCGGFAAVRSAGRRYRRITVHDGWWRGTVVERRSLAGELSLSCARPAADG